MFHFPEFASKKLCIHFFDDRILLLPGFPIQTSPDHRMLGFSPRLFAAYHVFHRLPTPRHPPDALINLFYSKKTSFFPCSIVNLHSLLGMSVLIRFETEKILFLFFQTRTRELVVGLERLELSTSRLSGVRSNHLSYRPAWSLLLFQRTACSLQVNSEWHFIFP